MSHSTDLTVSIVYCTARKGGFDILEDSVRHQTHPVEVIVVDELHRTSPSPFISVTPPPKKPGMFWNLSASLNAGVRAASGTLIVLLQDYIWLPPDAIAKYVQRYIQEGPKCLVTGVSDQYRPPLVRVNPHGDYSVWPDGFPGAPSGDIVFKDPRSADRAGFFVTIPLEWEANWGMFPRQAWTDVGGFDEDYDRGWGYDNCDFADRAQMAGYRIFLDCDNPVLCYSHINLFSEQKFRDTAPNNCELYNRKSRNRKKLGEPWKLNYA